jgi:hypothetical protein
VAVSSLTRTIRAQSVVQSLMQSCKWASVGEAGLTVLIGAGETSQAWRRLTAAIVHGRKDGRELPLLVA